jgi:hypothetical protein
MMLSATTVPMTVTMIPITICDSQLFTRVELHQSKRFSLPRNVRLVTMQRYQESVPRVKFALGGPKPVVGRQRSIEQAMHKIFVRRVCVHAYIGIPGRDFKEHVDR